MAYASWVDCLLDGEDPVKHGFTPPETEKPKNKRKVKKVEPTKSADTKMFVAAKTKKKVKKNEPIGKFSLIEEFCCVICSKEIKTLRRFAFIYSIKNGTESVFGDLDSYPEWKNLKIENSQDVQEEIEVQGICGCCSGIKNVDN